MLRLFGLVIVAGIFAAPAASAQNPDSSGSRGSGTNDQEVYVSEGDDESRRSGGSCSDQSDVTVITDEGTSHPSGGAPCRSESSPTPAPTMINRRLSSSAAETQGPTATPDSAPMASPVAAASPVIYLNVETPRVVSDTGGGIGMPFVVFPLVTALAAVGYLVVRAVRKIMQRDVTNLILEPEIPLLEDPPPLPLQRMVADIYFSADEPPRTEEIVIDGQLAETHSEADVRPRR